MLREVSGVEYPSYTVHHSCYRQSVQRDMSSIFRQRRGFTAMVHHDSIAIFTIKWGKNRKIYLKLNLRWGAYAIAFRGLVTPAVVGLTSRTLKLRKKVRERNQYILSYNLFAGHFENDGKPAELLSSSNTYTSNRRAVHRL